MSLQDITNQSIKSNRRKRRKPLSHSWNIGSTVNIWLDDGHVQGWRVATIIDKSTSSRLLCSYKDLSSDFDEWLDLKKESNRIRKSMNDGESMQKKDKFEESVNSDVFISGEERSISVHSENDTARPEDIIDLLGDAAKENNNETAAADDLLKVFSSNDNDHTDISEEFVEAKSANKIEKQLDTSTPVPATALRRFLNSNSNWESQVSCFESWTKNISTSKFREDRNRADFISPATMGSPFIIAQNLECCFVFNHTEKNMKKQNKLKPRRLEINTPLSVVKNKKPSLPSSSSSSLSQKMDTDLTVTPTLRAKMALLLSKNKRTEFSTNGDDDEIARIKQRCLLDLACFYMKYRPRKLSTVHKLLKKFNGHEIDLHDGLLRKYGCTVKSLLELYSVQSQQRSKKEKLAGPLFGLRKLIAVSTRFQNNKLRRAFRFWIHLVFGKNYGSPRLLHERKRFIDVLTRSQNLRFEMKLLQKRQARLADACRFEGSYRRFQLIQKMLGYLRSEKELELKKLAAAKTSLIGTSNHLLRDSTNGDSTAVKRVTSFINDCISPTSRDWSTKKSILLREEDDCLTTPQLHKRLEKVISNSGATCRKALGETKGKQMEKKIISPYTSHRRKVSFNAKQSESPYRKSVERKKRRENVFKRVNAPLPGPRVLNSQVISPKQTNKVTDASQVTLKEFVHGCRLTNSKVNFKVKDLAATHVPTNPLISHLNGEKESSEMTTMDRTSKCRKENDRTGNIRKIVYLLLFLLLFLFVAIFLKHYHSHKYESICTIENGYLENAEIEEQQIKSVEEEEKEEEHPFFSSRKDDKVDEKIPKSKRVVNLQNQNSNLREKIEALRVALAKRKAYLMEEATSALKESESFPETKPGFKKEPEEEIVLLEEDVEKKPEIKRSKNRREKKTKKGRSAGRRNNRLHKNNNRQQRVKAKMKGKPKSSTDWFKAIFSGNLFGNENDKNVQDSSKVVREAMFSNEPVMLLEPLGSIAMAVQRSTPSVKHLAKDIAIDTTADANGRLLCRVRAVRLFEGKPLRICANILSQLPPRANGKSGGFAQVATHCFKTRISKDEKKIRSSKKLHGYYGGLYSLQVIAISENGIVGRDHASIRLSDGVAGLELTFEALLI
eukprot:g2388.t1